MNYSNYKTKMLEAYYKISLCVDSCETPEHLTNTGMLIKNLCDLGNGWRREMFRDVIKPSFNMIKKIKQYREYLKYSQELLNDLCDKANQWSEEFSTIQETESKKPPVVTGFSQCLYGYN